MVTDVSVYNIFPIFKSQAVLTRSTAPENSGPQVYRGVRLKHRSLKKASGIYESVSLQSIINHLSQELSFGTLRKGLIKYSLLFRCRWLFCHQ